MTAIPLVLVIGVAILVQLLGVKCYLHWFKNFRLVKVPDPCLPKAAVILSVRGAAPTLLDCLNNLAEQNYPDYKIYVVVDHPSDPANGVIGQWLELRPARPVAIQFLENPSPNAYLKVSALLQAINSLSSDVDIAVVADADTIAYPDWLRDLVTPTLAPGVGLVTGNRWYDPTAKLPGTICRFFYNAVCVAPMYFMGATWAGSMAMTRDVFDSDFFREKMKNTPSDDEGPQASARHVGLNLQIQPDVMMYNGESCSMMQAFDFIKRQLLWTRLYHPTWHLLLGCTWGLYILLVGALISGGYHLAMGHVLLGITFLTAVICQMASTVWAAEQLHKEIAIRIKREQGRELPSIGNLTRAYLFLSLPLAFTVMCYAMLAAALSRQVSWSGITYDVVSAGPNNLIPPGGLRMQKYLPLADLKS